MNSTETTSTETHSADMDMQVLLDLQRQAFNSGPMPSAAQRIELIDKTIALLKDNEAALVEAVDADFGGRHSFQTIVFDLLVSVEALQYCRKHLHKWMRYEARGAKWPINLTGAKAYIQYQPVGVVGIMAPWNFPLQLIFSPLANAFAAGNRAMIKPSELTPKTAALLVNLVAQYFRPDELAVVTGETEVAQVFSGLAFDHLVFTGSPAVGKQVMAAAAKNLVPVTLELGGKCPVIVSSSADLAVAVERIMSFKSINAGQMCLAPDTVYLADASVAEFTELAAAWLAKALPKVLDNDQLTAMISARHYARVCAYLSDAEARGASIVNLAAPAAAFNQTTKKIAPHLVINPPPEADICREEIFGPILLIKTFSSLDTLLASLRREARPLALYFFGRDQAEISLIQQQTTSGGLTINDIAWHALQDNMPIGGVGNSGMGSYHGLDGFKRLSHARAVYRQGWFSLDRFIKPPYGKFTLKLLRKFLT